MELDDLSRDLTALTDEFDCRYLEDMMPGVVTTPHGIASYFMERLVGGWPLLESVTVWERPCCSATVTREVT